MQRTAYTFALALALAAGAAHGQSPPRVEVEVRGVSGPVRQPEAQTVMRGAGDALGRCFLRLRGVAIPLASRRYVVRIEPTGAAHVDEAAPVAPAADEPETRLRACFRAALGRYRYGAHAEGPSVLDVTVRLTPQN
jgi:hypothetical protein